MALSGTNNKPFKAITEMKRLYAVIAAVAFLAAGCQREMNDGLTLVAEGFGSGTKAAVDDKLSYWVTGEKVRINGSDYTVQLDGSNGKVTGVPSAGTYRALYPASLNSSATLTSDEVTVTIPASYPWTVDEEGRQVLDVPMAARATGSTLEFQHITAAITVEITNHYGFAVQVDDVTISSDASGTQYQLCGERLIELAGSNMSVLPNPSNTNTQVQVTFGGSDRLLILSGETARVQVPVLPVGEGNKFSISVTVHKDGDLAVTKTYPKLQTTGGELSRRKMAYAGFTVGFPFSVASGRLATIAPGNLVYDNGEWRFHTQQYDRCFTENTDDVSAYYSISGTFDLFGWAASGKGEYPVDPWSTSTTNAAYNPSNGYDWGQNIIGPYAAGSWETLEDWTYLFENRSASNVNGTTNARYVKATVVSVPGIILFPDSYTHPTDATGFTNANINQTDADYSFVVDAASWALMEASGAVFLPAAGIRSGIKVTIDNNGYYGHYWTKTANDTRKAEYLQFYNGNVKPSSDNYRSRGCSVRLVHYID